MFFEDIVFGFDNIKYVDLFDYKDGFKYGNMFKNEYDQYKNYKVRNLNCNSELGELLLKIYEYDFALNDLSLYLDLHPDDSDIYNLFKKYTEEQRKCVDIYEKKYGPMELDYSQYNKYMWDKGPWPFIGGDF